MRMTCLHVIMMAFGVLIWTQGVADAAPSRETLSGSPTGELITLKIEGWTCASCEKGIRRALEAVPGVQRADVSYARGGAVVEVVPGRVSHEQLIRAVAKAGNVFSSYHVTIVPNSTLTDRAGEQDGAWSWFLNRFK